MEHELTKQCYEQLMQQHQLRVCSHRPLVYKICGVCDVLTDVSNPLCPKCKAYQWKTSGGEVTEWLRERIEAFTDSKET